MGENNKIMNMKQYFKNLWMSLTGNNPYEAELNELRKQYEKATENVSSLQGMYYKSIEAYDAVKKHVTALEKRNASLTRQLKKVKTKQ